jgi:predicted dinucleotide-binding enzyme
MEKLMKIAILGAGQVGTALATALIRAGHTVTFGSRNPSSKSNPVAELVEAPTAVSNAELIINATPGGSSIALLESIGADVLGSRILLDVSNASDEKFDLIYPNDSVARRIQEAFPALRVVKSLNTMNTSVMTNPSAIAPTTVFLSGDDAEAKATVSALLVDLGWAVENQLDLGGIETARGPEHYFLLFFPTLQALRSPVFNVAVVR